MEQPIEIFSDVSELGDGVPEEPEENEHDDGEKRYADSVPLRPTERDGQGRCQECRQADTQRTVTHQVAGCEHGDADQDCAQDTHDLVLGPQDGSAENQRDNDECDRLIGIVQSNHSLNCKRAHFLTPLVNQESTVCASGVYFATETGRQ